MSELSSYSILCVVSGENTGCAGAERRRNRYQSLLAHLLLLFLQYIFCHAFWCHFILTFVT